MKSGWACGFVALLLLPAASAQQLTAEDELFLDARLDRSTAMVARQTEPGFSQEARFGFTFQDLSIERSAPQAGPAQPHFLAAIVVFDPSVSGEWQAPTPSYNPRVFYATDSGSGFFAVRHNPTATEREVSGRLVLTLSNPGTQASFVRELPFTIIVVPSAAATIDVQDPEKAIVRPFELVTARMSITNQDVYPQTYRVSALVYSAEGINPSDVSIGGLGDRYLNPGETRTLEAVFQTPRSKFWYNTVPMTIQFAVSDPNGFGRQTDIFLLTVSGFYVSENLFLLVLLAAAQIFILIWLIIFAKRRYERAYLGRPVPPWTIPAEIVHLEKLKREEPRAHYVLRYFLMEEEYRSALNWFYAYKKISKKQLKAEIRAVELREKAAELVSLPAAQFDKASARLQRRYARRMEQTEARTQKRIERLRAKLQRTYEKDFEKDHEKWEKKVEKLQKKHNKPYLKAKAKWDKETKKALEKWEKPFRKEKQKYEAKLAKAKEAYAKKVKKADKDVWRAWREQMEDWEAENKLRKKEGRELAPEPALFSEKAGAPELPAPFEEPPKPELPPEPQPEKVVDLPQEPQLTTPDLFTSHYAKKARKVQRKGAKEIRKLELGLAAKLNKLHHRRDEAGVKVEERREKLLAESQAAPMGSAGFVDRVLRRSQTDIDRRHHMAFIRGQTKERIAELEDVEEAAVERVRIQGERERADLEAKLLVQRAELRKAAKTGTSQEATTVSERIASLERELGEAKVRRDQELAAAKLESKKRLEDGIARLKADERERLDRELGRGQPAPAAEPTKA